MDPHGLLRHRFSKSPLILQQVIPDEECSLDLADHLVESPETRFTALILLCRYMKRVGLFDRRVVQSHKERGANERRIKEDVLWESAVACLALSVKVRLACLNGALTALVDRPLQQISSDAWAPRRPILSVSFQMLGSSFIPFSELEVRSPIDTCCSINLHKHFYLDSPVGYYFMP